MMTRCLRTSVAFVALALAPVSGFVTGCSSSSSPETTKDAGSTLYSRLGKHDGIRSAVNAIVAAELMNDDIGSYFFNQGSPPATGHPSADQIELCFTNFVGKAAGGPEAYPTTVSDDGGSFTCRDMSTIHQGLLISKATFDEFVMIAGATLTSAGVDPADVTTLAAALNGTQSDVVNSKYATDPLQAYPGGSGSGSSSGSGS